MSHHPSSADLAAFRATFPRVGPVVHVPTFWQPHSRHAEARREAAALRSRAYAAAACPACGDANLPDGPGCRCYGD